MISVIIPVYNVEAYLPTCIESIFDQTYKDFEILLIDDGSTDNSGKICDEYAKRDNRCIAIHQPNKGVYNARNTGLSHATGEYISFVDSDDYIHPQMLEILYEALQKGDYDFSMVAYKQVWDYSKCSPVTKTNICILDTSTLIHRLYNISYKNNSLPEISCQVLWNKLYRRSLIGESRFKITGSGDTEFNNRIYLKTKSAIYIDEPLYYWYQRATSITHQSINLNFIDRINSYFISLNEIPQKYIDYRACCLEKLYKTMINVRYHSQNTQFHDYTVKLITQIKEQTIKEFLINKSIKQATRLGLLIFFYIPFFYRLFINFSEFKINQRNK